MPIADFDGTTLVAFTDISGFKEMMRDKSRAIEALGHLNSCGFRILRNQQSINGFFISDCGILFVRDTNVTVSEQLTNLLRPLEQLNRELLEHNIMLTTSIAYGHFSYHQRNGFTGIEKHPIYGDAYVTAFMDNESGTPKIQPGQCRIVKVGLPADILDGINDNNIAQRLSEDGRSHWMFYWMVDDRHGIEQFQSEYKDTYSLKYAGMLRALKNAR